MLSACCVSQTAESWEDGETLLAFLHELGRVLLDGWMGNKHVNITKNESTYYYHLEQCFIPGFPPLVEY